MFDSKTIESNWSKNMQLLGDLQVEREQERAWNLLADSEKRKINRISNIRAAAGGYVHALNRLWAMVGASEFSDSDYRKAKNLYHGKTTTEKFSFGFTFVGEYSDE